MILISLSMYIGRGSARAAANNVHWNHYYLLATGFYAAASYVFYIAAYFSRSLSQIGIRYSCVVLYVIVVMLDVDKKHFSLVSYTLTWRRENFVLYFSRESLSRGRQPKNLDLFDNVFDLGVYVAKTCNWNIGVDCTKAKRTLCNDKIMIIYSTCLYKYCFGGITLTFFFWIEVLLRHWRDGSHDSRLSQDLLSLRN